MKDLGSCRFKNLQTLTTPPPPRRRVVGKDRTSREVCTPFLFFVLMQAAGRTRLT